MEEETGEVELRIQAAQGRQEVGLEHSELEEAEEQYLEEWAKALPGSVRILFLSYNTDLYL